MNEENTPYDHSNVSDDGQEELSIIVDPGQEPMRLDKFLLNRLEKVSRSKIQAAIAHGIILVNQKEIKSNYKVRPGDAIFVSFLKDPNDQREIVGEDITISVIYEDEDLLVLNKQAGLVVHPGIGNYTGTLVNALVYRMQEQKLPVLASNPSNRPGLVHRLDKDTTGLMVVAKTEAALSHLAKQFFDRTIDRTYQTIVWGSFDNPEGKIEGNIGRHPTDRLQMYVFEEGLSGKTAVTHYKVLRDYYYVSVVECRLETGRTHQIRVHMKYAGHPVFGDERYGGSTIRKGTIHSKYKQFVFNCLSLCNRQALHAKTLGFVHPTTGEYMSFDSELPNDMAQLEDKWKKYFEHKAQS